MEKIKIIRVEIPEDVLEMLKRKTGENTNKDAIIRAVEHYINCPLVKEKNNKDKRRKAGRHPIYLVKLMKLMKSS